VFTPAERDRVRAYVLDLAARDARVVAGAEVGGLVDAGDRWSDLDLTFAVAERVPLSDVLGDWTSELAGSLDAIHLFDLPSGAAVYRVFLLPSCLQVDISFAPAAEFGARGPSFRLLYGRAVEQPHPSPPNPASLFGIAVHHAVRARFCIERERYWQAEYWISAVRDNALALACLRRGLSAAHGRGFDDLPREVLLHARDTLVASVARAELLDALAASVRTLIAEAVDVRDLARSLEPQLAELTSPEPLS
jgi:hypothetical protein